MAISGTASAQVGSEAASSGVKGTVGGALLGGEAVMLVEAAFDVQPWWAYALGGGLGAVGGGIGGYFLDQNAGSPAASMGVLVGGLVLAVPTTIAVLSATAFEPDKNPEIEPGEALASRPLGPVMRVRPLTPSLAMVQGGSFSLQLPAVAFTSFAGGARPFAESPLAQSPSSDDGLMTTATGPAATGPAVTARAETSLFVPVLGMSF